LTEPEAKLLCKSYGIPVPEFQVACALEEVPKISRELGFPLVGKIVSPQIIHKTESGGIVSNIQSADEAENAFRCIIGRVRQHNATASIDGILFERMEPPGIEVIVGATQDAQFGKTLLFGLGGVFVEAMRDVTIRLAPISFQEAMSMVQGIRSAGILKGHRGVPSADLKAIANIICAVSSLVLENDNISELDLNPVIVHERGATAVDARIILSHEPSPVTVTAYPATSLQNFFKAESVAVIGASSTPGKIGYEILRSISQYDYSGKVYPVNPGSDSILGMKCYPSISEIPEKVDLAVLTVPAKLVPSIVEQCGINDVKSLVIVSGGFKETGADETEEQTVSTARRHGIRIIGPNCIGVFDGKSRLDTFFQSHERMLRPGGGNVAFITQSGTFGTMILEWASERGVGISKFVSYGNRCDVDEGDLLEFFGQDNETSTIGIYAEGLGNGRKLYDAARRITPSKPVVILKIGKTDLGSKAAKSHTGWLAGSYDVAKAAFEQSGMIVSENIEQLFDAIRVLSSQPLPTTSEVVMVTNGAGPCVMAADRLAERSMKIVQLSQNTLSELTSKLPPYCLLSETTVDLTGSATSSDYGSALRILAKDPAVGIMMPFFVFQDTPLDEGIVEVLKDVKTLGKPLICCAAGGVYTRTMTRRIEGIGIPVCETGDRAADAAYALVRQAYVSGRVK